MSAEKLEPCEFCGMRDDTHTASCRKWTIERHRRDTELSALRAENATLRARVAELEAERVVMYMDADDPLNAYACEVYGRLDRDIIEELEREVRDNFDDYYSGERTREFFVKFEGAHPDDGGGYWVLTPRQEPA